MPKTYKYGDEESFVVSEPKDCRITVTGVGPTGKLRSTTLRGRSERCLRDMDITNAPLKKHWTISAFVCWTERRKSQRKCFATGWMSSTRSSLGGLSNWR